ncbi:Hsp20/alpha crystallin family protein, partial [Klebsiella pneumoniae]
SMQPCRTAVPRRLTHNLKRVPSLKTATTQTRNMAFFPRTIYNQESSFTPLFRLLDDFDSYSRQSNNVCRRSAIPQWQPKFDVRETSDSYELHGELAGMSKENVHIEFTEPQTMLVKGKVERTYTAGTSPSGEVEAAPASDDAASKASSTHQATVEDDSEAADGAYEVVEKAAEEAKPVDKAKYWLSERSIGEFSRSFNFPSRVDQDDVSASFKDGVLSITVPKAKKHETRRIAIN